nr:hypothetical protein [Pseudomonadota bacterium]
VQNTLYQLLVDPAVEPKLNIRAKREPWYIVDVYRVYTMNRNAEEYFSTFSSSRAYAYSRYINIPHPENGFIIPQLPLDAADEAAKGLFWNYMYTGEQTDDPTFWQWLKSKMTHFFRKHRDVVDKTYHKLKDVIAVNPASKDARLDITMKALKWGTQNCIKKSWGSSNGSFFTRLAVVQEVYKSSTPPQLQAPVYEICNGNTLPNNDANDAVAGKIYVEWNDCIYRGQDGKVVIKPLSATLQSKTDAELSDKLKDPIFQDAIKKLVSAPAKDLTSQVVKGKGKAEAKIAGGSSLGALRADDLFDEPGYGDSDEEIPYKPNSNHK